MKDIRLPGDKDRNDARRVDEPPPDDPDPAGLDEYYNQRDQLYRERMMGNALKDMTISIFLRNQTPNTDHFAKNPGRVREDISKREGSIEFTSPEDEDGTVEICVSSATASKVRPVRFHINVVTSEWAQLEAANRVEKNVEVTKLNEQGVEVKQTMTRLERDMATFTRRVKSILDRADVNKDQEVSFHDQSIAMNSAASYWPIIRLVFLFLTGFAQVNHIIRFMKTHHIG